jgi:hypothetical protein
MPSAKFQVQTDIEAQGRPTVNWMKENFHVRFSGGDSNVSLLTRQFNYYQPSTLYVNIKNRPLYKIITNLKMDLISIIFSFDIVYADILSLASSCFYHHI